MRDWLVNLPESLTESDLVDMVEGTLSPAREAVAIAALRAEPRLGLLIKQIRRDKAAIVDLEKVEAPPVPSGFAAGVMAELAELAELGEREERSLRELAEQSQERALGIPVSTLQYDQTGPVAGLFESRLFRALSIAAGLALVAGVGWYVSTEMRPRASTTVVVGVPTPPRLIEGSDSGIPEGETAPALANVPAQLPGDNAPGSGSAGDLASASNSRERASANEPSRLSSTQETSRVTSADRLAQAPKPAGAHDSVAPDADTLTQQQAVALAREGRLVVMVAPRDPPGLMRRLDNLVKLSASTALTPTREPVWRALRIEAMPQAYAGLDQPWVPRGSEADLDLHLDDDPSRPSGSSPPALAGSSGQAPGVRSPAEGSGSNTRALLPARHVVRAVLIASIEPSEPGLQELVRVISEQPVGAEPVRVSYRVLDVPMSAPVSLDPSAVLWWTLPPARWARPLHVPVVVQTRE